MENGGKNPFQSQDENEIGRRAKAAKLEAEKKLWERHHPGEEMTFLQKAPLVYPPTEQNSIASQLRKIVEAGKIGKNKFDC